MPGRSGAIRAGRAFVELFADDSRLVRGLQSAQKRLRAFGAAVTGLGTQLLGFGAAVGAPLLAAAQAFGILGDAVAKASIRTGIGTEALSELSYAAGLAGADAATLEKGVLKMQRNIVELSDGTATAVDAFGKLGLTLSDLEGRSPDEQFAVIADKLSEVEDATLKAALAQEIFGRSGAQLIPLMNSGAAGIEALREEARRLGLSISGEDAAAAEEFQDALDRVWRTAKAVTFQIGAALAPAITEAANIVARLVADLIAWAAENRGLVRTVAIVAGLVAAFGAGLVALGLTVTAASFALGGLLALLGALFSPITLVAAALAGLVTWFLRSGIASEWLSTTFGPLAEQAASAFGAIQNALASGDFGAAAQVLWSTLRMWWAKGTGWVMEKWIGLKNGMIDVWREMGATIQRVIVDVMAFVRRQVSEVGLTITQQLGELALETSGLDDNAKALARNALGIAFNTARETEAEEIEADRLGARQEIDEQNAREAAESLERYNDELAASQAQLDEARTQWEAAVAAANSATPTERGGAGLPDFSNLDELLDGLEAGTGAARSAATQNLQTGGTFSSLAAQIFGAQRGPQERTAAATEETARNTRRIARQGGRLRFGT